MVDAPAGVEVEPLYSSAFLTVAGFLMRLLKVTTEGASIVESWRVFHAEIVLGKKLYL